MPRPTDVSDAPPSASQTETAQSPSDAFNQAADHLRELKSFGQYYLSAKLDALRLTIRRAVIYTLLGLVAAVAAVTMIVMAVVLTLIGLSDLINWALHFAYAPLSPWIGPLIVGLGILLLLGFGGVSFVSKRIGQWRRQTIHKYEHKRRQQREQFGRDVGQAADQ